MTDTDFTDYDRAMLDVMAKFDLLREWLADHAEWFHLSWNEVSDEPMPFFEVFETETDTGVELTLVFLLRRIELAAAS